MKAIRNRLLLTLAALTLITAGIGLAMYLNFLPFNWWLLFLPFLFFGGVAVLAATVVVLAVIFLDEKIKNL